MKINGIAHIVLNVADPAVSVPFYEKIFAFLEFVPAFRTDRGAYFLGGKTAIAIMPATDGKRFEQTRVGMHHLSFRAYTREDVDRFHAHLVALGAKIVHPPEEGPWAPGYYSVLFEDPDGIRLEMNYVAGKGLLAPDTKFNPVGYEDIATD